MISRLTFIFTTFCFLCCISTAQAASVQTAACNTHSSALCATGITALDVDGTFYDVNFALLSNSELFANGTAPFLGDLAGAITARDAGNAALNTTSVTFLAVAGQDWSGFLVPYNTDVDTIRGDWSDISNMWAAGGSSENIGGGLFAEFTATTVPLPASVWLFGAGLLALIRLTRKDNKSI